MIEIESGPTVLELQLRGKVLALLSKNKVQVEFVKADGTTRKMLATRNNALIPKEHQPTESVVTEGLPLAEPKPENLDIVKCFDLEKQAWRSFRVDSLLDFSEV